MDNNKKKLQTIDILKTIAFFVISAILFLMFLDTIKFLLIAALVSILIVGIQTLYEKFAPKNIKEKVFSVLNEEIDQNDKSLKNTILKKIQAIKNHRIFSLIDKFISSISDTIFNFISSGLLKLSKQSIDLTKDQDNFTQKGFPSKKALLKKCIYLFLIFSAIIIALQVLFNIFQIASFIFVFAIKALCVLLPLAGLILFIGGIFYAFNKEKHDLIREIKTYLVDIDEKTNLKNLAQNVAQELNKLSRGDNLNKEQIENQLKSAQENLNKTFDSEKNEKLKKKIIENLEKNLFGNNEELNIEKLNKFNNYELKQIKTFIEKSKESVQTNYQAENNDEFVITDANGNDVQNQQPNNSKLDKILEAINAKLENQQNENKVSDKISDVYYLVLGKAHEIKNYVKEKI